MTSSPATRNNNRQKKQTSLSDAFSRKKQVVALDTTTELQTTAPLAHPCVYDKSRERITDITDFHMKPYKDGIDRFESRTGQEAVSDVVRQGTAFVDALLQLGPERNVPYPSSVTQDLADIVGNHHLNPEQKLTSRAASLLDDVLQCQPPARTVPAKSGEFLMLEKLPEDIQPCNRITPVHSGASLRVTNKERLLRESRAGVRWLLHELKRAHDRLKKLMEGLKGGAVDDSAVKGASGALSLLKYFSKVWRRDLEARLEAAYAYPLQRGLRPVQLMLTEAFLFRALAEGSPTDRKNCCELLVELNDTGKALLSAKEGGQHLPFHCRQHAEGVLAVCTEMLYQILALTGALEDVGMSDKNGHPKDLGVVVPLTRDELDQVFVDWLNKHDKGAWRALLDTLPARDVLRSLALWFGTRYDKCNFDLVKQRQHGSAAFTAVVSKFGGGRADKPATFLDIPPAAVMHVVADIDIAGMTTRVFDRDEELLATFTQYLAAAAAQEVPRLIKENRWQATSNPAEWPHAAPLAGDYTLTEVRAMHSMPASDAEALVRKELAAVRASAQKVLNHVESKSEVVDMEASDEDSQDTLPYSSITATLEFALQGLPVSDA